MHDRKSFRRMSISRHSGDQHAPLCFGGILSYLALSLQKPAPNIWKEESMCRIKRLSIAICLATSIAVCMFAAAGEDAANKKPSPDEALKLLKDGNERFAAGKPEHPHSDAARMAQAGRESQSAHAYATLLSCSDSRVPVEYIFDAGVMDVFVVRVAGNVCGESEAASIEYGLAHVKTPVLVVLGHSQCGAVAAAFGKVQGKEGHQLERNIPPLVERIVPAVQRAMKGHEGAREEELLSLAAEENVWQGVSQLFMKSAAVRQLVKDGKVKVVGALYDIESGKVNWLSEAKVAELLRQAEESPAGRKRSMPRSAETFKGGTLKADRKKSPEGAEASFRGLSNAPRSHFALRTFLASASRASVMKGMPETASVSRLALMRSPRESSESLNFLAPAMNCWSPQETLST